MAPARAAHQMTLEGQQQQTTLESIMYCQASLLQAALKKAMLNSRTLADDKHIHNALEMLDTYESAGLGPFLECLKSHEMSGPLVLLTMESIKRLLENGVLTTDSSDQSISTLNQLAKTLNGTRFEASDLASDEVALYELLQVLLIITGEEHQRQLDDDALIACVETMLSLLIPRFSELLKRAAEDAIVGLTRSVFSKFDELADCNELENNRQIQIPGRRQSIDQLEASASESNEQTVAVQIDPRSKTYTKDICYAIVGFCARVLSFHDQKGLERLVPLAVKMVTAIFETKHVFEDQKFMAEMSESIVKQIVKLFSQLAPPSGDLINNLALFLFAEYRHVLHGEYLLFMNHILSLGKQLALIHQSQQPPSSPVRPVKPSHRESILNAIYHLSKTPNSLSDLYGLYECDPIYQFNVSDLISFITDQTGKNVERGVAKKAIMTLGNLLRHVSHGCADNVKQDNQTAKELMERRNLKALHSKAAQVFNNKPKEVEQFLVDNGLLDREHTRADLAKQIRLINGVNKRKLGEWLAKPGNEDICRAFIQDLDFRNKRIDDALRLMLATFRLPGESQEINRVMEAFAPVLYEQSPGDFASVDSAYIMAYSVIMLNTDQHNPQYKGRRMTEEDFVKNNRGNNDGRDYDREFLCNVYQSVRLNEILMPEEHEGELAFNYLYTETVNLSRSVYPNPRQSIPISNVAKDLLDILYPQSLPCLCLLFEQQHQVVNDTVTASIALHALKDLIASVGTLNQPDRLDEAIMSVWTASNIERYYTSTSGNVVARYLAKVENGRELLRLLINTIKVYGEVMRTGWKQLADLVFILHESRIISSEWFAPEKPRVDPPNGSGRMSPASADSLLASITSFMYTKEQHTQFDRKPTPDTLFVERTSEFLSKECKFEDIFQDSRLLSVDALASMLSAFMTIVNPSVQSKWSQKTKALAIDISIYCAMQNKDRLGAVWPVIFDALGEVGLRGQDEVLREHAVIGLGRLALKMAERDDDPMLRVNLVMFLKHICSLAPDAFERVAEPVLAILLKIVEYDSQRVDNKLLSGPEAWPPYFTIMAMVSRKRQCAPFTLGLLLAACNANAQPLFPLDFFSEYIDLLSEFITAITGDPKTEELAVDMARTAIKRLSDLESVIKQTRIEPALEFIIPVHLAVGMQCCHGTSKEIRQSALVSLSRMVMSDRLPIDAITELEACLFPILDELQSDRMIKLNGTIEDTQMGVCSLTAKVFLSNVQDLRQGLKFNHTLSVLVQKLFGFLKFKSDSLRDGIPETVKNLLFVLKTCDYLQVDDQFWQMIGAVMPDLRNEIYPKEPVVPGVVKVATSADSNGYGADRTDEIREQNNLNTRKDLQVVQDMIASPVASPSAIHFV